jgi:hypothetical protein
MQRRGSVVFGALACVLGLLLALAFIGALEAFFSMNERHQWVARPKPTYPPPQLSQEALEARDSLKERNLSYYDSLEPVSHNSWEVYEKEGRPEYSHSAVSPGCKPWAGKPSWMFSGPHCSIRQDIFHKLSLKPIASTVYHSDEFGHRKIPTSAARAGQSLYFLGCSFTFGEAVSEEETFASRVTLLARPSRGHNLGMGAHGPHLTLHVLNTRDLEPIATKNGEGVVIYTYINDHLRRALGTMSWLEHHALHQPYAELTTDGKIEIRGTFMERRPIRTSILRFLGKSHTLKFFSVDLPPIDQDALEHFVRIIDAIRQESFRKFGTRKFVFAIFPGEDRYAYDLVPLLRRYEIDFFDYSAIYPNTYLKGHQYFPANGHPTAIFHRFYADLLFHDLVKKGYLRKNAPARP